MTNSFNARSTLKSGDRTYDIWSLAALPKDKVARLPYSLKILLENTAGQGTSIGSRFEELRAMDARHQI